MPITLQSDPTLAALELKQRQLNAYLKITPNEFQECRWDKADANIACPNIKYIIRLWNQIEGIVRDDILLGKSPLEQKAIFNFYAHIMAQSSQMGDFQTANAIFCALNCAAISRLHPVLMNEQTDLIIKQHASLFDPSLKQKRLKEKEADLQKESIVVVPLLTPLLAAFVDVQGMMAPNDAKEEQLKKLEKQKAKIKNDALRHFESFRTVMTFAPTLNDELLNVEPLSETKAYALSQALLPRRSSAEQSPKYFNNIEQINQLRVKLGLDEIADHNVVAFIIAKRERRIREFLAPLAIQLNQEAQIAHSAVNIDEIFNYVAKTIAEHPDEDTINNLKYILPYHVTGRNQIGLFPKIEGLPSAHLFNAKLDELKQKLTELNNKLSPKAKLPALQNHYDNRKSIRELISLPDNPTEDEIEQQFQQNSVKIKKKKRII